jgi:hypothetical protein
MNRVRALRDRAFNVVLGPFDDSRRCYRSFGVRELAPALSGEACLARAPASRGEAKRRQAAALQINLRMAWRGRQNAPAAPVRNRAYFASRRKRAASSGGVGLM